MPFNVSISKKPSVEKFSALDKFTIKNKLDQALNIHLFYTDENTFSITSLAKNDTISFDIVYACDIFHFSYATEDGASKLREIRFSSVSLWDYLTPPNGSNKTLTYSGQFFSFEKLVIDFGRSGYVPQFTDPDGIAYGPDNVIFTQSVSGSTLEMSLGLAG